MSNELPSAAEYDHTGEAVELLQALIRNECVNDGSPDSGDEVRNADLLQTYLEGGGLDVQRFTSRPGRTSVVARIEGSDPTAPALCLMGHTDVVPVNASGWTQDPFGGELINGEVWGRGSIDMLNMTASMAIAFKQLATSGFRPRGTLIFFGVADEEAGGTWGAEWMVDHHWDAVGADYVVTEAGGWSQGKHEGAIRVPVMVAEKGIAGRRLRVRGTPSHGSRPYGADNALIKAAAIITRLAEYRGEPKLDDVWRSEVAVMQVTDELKAALIDPGRIREALEQLPVLIASRCHAKSHNTFSPNTVQGGQKFNMIPDTVDIEVDIRSLPGVTQADIDRELHLALGELAHHVEVVAPEFCRESTASSFGDNRLWESIERRTRSVHPGAELVPSLLTGGTDSPFFRKKGAIAYGTGIYSPTVTLESFGSRFHGNDERIDAESLGLATDFWIGIATDVLT